MRRGQNAAVGGRRAIAVGSVIALVAALLILAGVARSTNDERAHAATRPNVVVIQVDDMRSDELELLTQTVAALRGATFDRSEVATSLCCPSRATFLSGQYSWNNRVGSNNDGYQLDRTNTLNTWLHDSGYSTAFIGKYLNGYTCGKAIPPGWDDWQALCRRIYGMFKYTMQDNGSLVTYGTAATDYQTDVIADRASATITRLADAGKPFFTWITPTAPHSGPGPRVAPRYAQSLANWVPPASPAVGEANVLDKPAWVQQLKPLTGATRKSILLNERGRGRMLLAVDDLVARTVATLRDTNQLDNTVIVFTSDNGFLRGEHRIRTGKEVGYRESLEVPLLISGPGIPEHHVPDLVGNIDLAPTIADLAGITPGRAVDGRSLVPLLTGSGLPPRALFHRIVGDNTSDGLTPRHPNGDAVTTERFKYMRLGTGEEELYDYAVDPYELVNVAGTPKYSEVETNLRNILTAGSRCSGTACNVALPNIPPRAVGSVRCTIYFDCAFDGSPSTDIDGGALQFAWDFGDGATGTGVTTAHTYDASGSYTATLTVTDSSGATRSTTIVAAGTANIAPVAVPAAQCTDLGCDFTSIASYDPDGYIVSYRWQFGNGRAASLPSPSHAYTTPGTYTASLYVTDNRGAITKSTISVTVIAPNVLPTAVATYTCVDLSCQFDGAASSDNDGTIVSWVWDFGDGVTASGPTPTHDFSSAGVYSVNLIVVDDDGATSVAPAMLDVTVTDPIIPPAP